ncbi:MAG: sulfotransferase, partial [Betaproteobacteria bacterium]|nr:sulfotransferase [Betaproteobacteria bacterium]
MPKRVTKYPYLVNIWGQIGTGRCGSTLISNILNHHPDVLSLSEFFTFVTDLGTLIPQAFPAMQINGKQFWQIVSGVYAKQNIMLTHNIAIKEVLYPFKTDVRFNASTGVPALLQTTLPHLTPEYHALFDQIHTVIAARGIATAEAHYHALFDWLAAHFGKSIWVERSGGSLRVIERLYQHFPNAKFLHIVRDGRDCALSMQRHNGFKMVLLVFQITEILGVDPY